MSPPMYNDIIREHSRHPRNHGSLPAPDIRHEDLNPLCGDRIRIELLVGADELVTQAMFQGDACMIAKAAGSLLTEMIVGMPLARVESLPEGSLFDALGAEIQTARRNCVLLPLSVLQTGVRQYLARGIRTAG